MTIEALPKHLRERTRLARTGTTGPSRTSAPVVYWQRKVLRADDNAALEVAIAAAHERGAELLVLLTVEDRYKHATARRQTFVLEGALAVAVQLREKGLRVALHVARRGHRQNVIRSLSHRASLIVAEEPFCSPWLAGVNGLVAAASPAEIWLVDSDSLVPCSLVAPSSCHRAYAYEAATKTLLRARVTAPVWPKQPLPLPPSWQGAVPGAESERSLPGVNEKCAGMDPFELQAAVAALVSEMDAADQSVRRYTIHFRCAHTASDIDRVQYIVYYVPILTILHMAQLGAHTWRLVARVRALGSFLGTRRPRRLR